MEVQQVRGNRQQPAQEEQAIEWNPQLVNQGIQNAAQVAIPAAGMALLPQVQEAAAAVYTFVPREALDPVVAAGCAKATQCTQAAVQNLGEEYCAPGGSLNVTNLWE